MFPVYGLTVIKAAPRYTDAGVMTSRRCGGDGGGMVEGVHGLVHGPLFLGTPNPQLTLKDASEGL